VQARLFHTVCCGRAGVGGVDVRGVWGGVGVGVGRERGGEPRGGCVCARSASEISLGEVMRALGGIPSEDEICSQFTGNQDICVHYDGCGLKPVWTSITDFVNSVFDGVPISTLLTGTVDVKFVQITSRSGAKGPLRTRPAA